MLPFETFKTIIKNAPLISIDQIVSNQVGQILLGKRNNRPAQGYWFVPRGRIRKGESMSVAFK
jgi:colanic acid biosynthesis protein WcaH